MRSDYRCRRFSGGYEGSYYEISWVKNGRKIVLNANKKKATQFCKKWGIKIYDPEDRLTPGYYGNSNMHLR